MIQSGKHNEAKTGRRLKEREKKILTLTVYYYISTGEPVGSRFLSKKLDLGLSPATVRNVMADLEEMGFLRQPHPSSGRIPTDLGYRCYVDQLIKLRRPRPTTVQQMRDRLRQGGTTVEEIFQKASQTLSSVSSHLGLVMGPRIFEEGFRQLQFIRVGRRRVLAVIVSDSGLIQNKMIELEDDWNQKELSAMSEIWNRRFSSKPVREVKVELLAMMAADKAELDRLLEAALSLGRQALVEEERSENIYLEGTVNMLAWPEFASPGKLRLLMEAIEEKSRLLHLLDRSMKADGIQIFIGEEMSLPELREISLIAAPYSRGGEVLGVLGVIGPKRMEYGKLIPIVDYMAVNLSEYLSMK